MNEKIKYFIAGLFIGLSELLPGISGATVALMFGVYEKILNFLSRFKDFNLILPLIIGMIISVLSFSNIIDFLYKNYTDIFNLLIALLMIVNHEIKEHRIQPSMSDCLKGKRIANREVKDHIEYKCIKSKAETEIYLGEKSIKKLILK